MIDIRKHQQVWSIGFLTKNRIRSKGRCKWKQAQELHRPAIKKLKNRRVYARFKNNIWAVKLDQVGSLSPKSRNVKILYVIDVFTKYACVKPLKDKKEKTVLNALIVIVNESNRKPNKLWFDQGKEFYKKFMQKWLDDNDILMYLTYNEGK